MAQRTIAPQKSDGAFRSNENMLDYIGTVDSASNPIVEWRGVLALPNRA